MNLGDWKQVENLLNPTYFKQAVDASKTREKLVQQLIQHKKIPVEGWDEQLIELFLKQLSLMDSNNFPSNCGVGEREARFASGIVARRHFNLGHGVGRSGDLTEVQPKAAGSSLIAKLTNCLLKDLMKSMGIEDDIQLILAPVATGMSLVLTMLTLRDERPNAQNVIWSRIDQKACFKSIITAGFKPVIIDQKINVDEMVTDVDAINIKIKELGADNIVCVMTTTSCFAPRSCDNIEEVAKICKEFSIPHLVNNAYGLQSTYHMKRIQKAVKNGRLDVFVQSTDKNLMVPVGGTIIAGFNKKLINDIAKIYPGRASLTPTLDTFITLLNIGKNGYKLLVDTRTEMYQYLLDKLTEIATKHNEKILNSMNNYISIGMTLKNINEKDCTMVGSMLFIKNVSGARVITTREIKEISGYKFTGWGAHCNSYFTPYLTCASSLGMNKNDVDLFIQRLDTILLKIKKSGDAPK